MSKRARNDWKVLTTTGELFAGTELGKLGGQLRAAGDYPEDLTRTPLIIDTDIGGDPDDAIALAIAARHVPSLTLVITTDETSGELGYGHRARFARHLLDMLERSDVQVVAGAVSKLTPYFCVVDLVPSSLPPPPSAALETVSALLARTSGPVRWLGIGPLTNLANVLTEIPEARQRLRITQMAGALQYRDPDRAEHNVRYDVPAAHRVVTAIAELGCEVEWVLADVTFSPQVELTASSEVYRTLAAGPPWAKLIANHMDRWFAGAYPHTMQHDALTLSAALELPFVESDTRRIVLGTDGRMQVSDGGVDLFVSVSARYPAFMQWLSAALAVDHPR
jgi:inosine-uridine nucleoside N-ribohydrolase